MEHTSWMTHRRVGELLIVLIQILVLVYLWCKIQESSDEDILHMIVKTVLGSSLFRCKFYIRNCKLDQDMPFWKQLSLS